MSSHSPITSALGTAEREGTGGVLQSALVDLIDLALIGKQAHWNVVGTHFRSVHLQLDELVNAARNFTDQVAERAAAIGCSPDGRARTVTEQSALPAFPSNWQKDNDVIRAMVDILDKVVHRMRRRIEETDKTDLVTQDLLLDITAKLEEAHWMWQAQLA
jgi:starvation-inducible DNA-binding protein